MGNGHSTRFWSDVWVGKEPLMNFSNSELLQSDLNMKVCDFISADGDWDWDRISIKLSTRGCMKLSGHLPPRERDDEDR